MDVQRLTGMVFGWRQNADNYEEQSGHLGGQITVKYQNVILITKR